MSKTALKDAPILKQIEQDINDNNIVLYMKGTPETPMCGFSGFVVQLLKHYGVDFKGVNVLEDNALRQGVKDFSNWPTIPQLYVKGEFVGGSDIAREMHQSGELLDLLNEKGVSVSNQ